MKTNYFFCRTGLLEERIQKTIFFSENFQVYPKVDRLVEGTNPDSVNIKICCICFIFFFFLKYFKTNPI